MAASSAAATKVSQQGIRLRPGRLPRPERQGAEFSLAVTATFQPDCTPPMTVVWSDIKVTDTTNGISASL
jgi:hypothetical protein